MENCRHGDKQRLRVWYEPWEKRKSDPVETVYSPNFPVHHAQATRAGHGGGDFFTSYHFAEAIRTSGAALSRVYRGIDMSIAGIQAWRSALNDSAPMEIPDFRASQCAENTPKTTGRPTPSAKRRDSRRAVFWVRSNQIPQRKNWPVKSGQTKAISAIDSSQSALGTLLGWI